MTQQLHMITPAAITDGVLTFSTIPETDYAAWASGTTYAVGATRIYVASGIHWVIQCIQAHTAATGGSNDPSIDINRTSGTGAYWLRYSYTNKWRVADGRISDQATFAAPITVEYTAQEAATAVALFNTACNNIDLTVTNGATSEVRHVATAPAIETAGVIDWWSYLFAPIEYKSEMLFASVPIFPGDLVQLDIYGLPTNGIGEIVMGADYALGTAIFPLSVGITDYSTKDRDTFGNAYITPRAFASRAEYKAAIPTITANRVKRLLSAVRATPVVIYTTPGDNATGAMVYGLIKSFDIDEVSVTTSYLTLQIEGLI